MFLSYTVSAKANIRTNFVGGLPVGTVVSCDIAIYLESKNFAFASCVETLGLCFDCNWQFASQTVYCEEFHLTV
jgi:hypothetical protein